MPDGSGGTAQGGGGAAPVAEAGEGGQAAGAGPEAGAGEGGSAGSSGSGPSELEIVIDGNGTVAVTDAAACLSSAPCVYPAAPGTSFDLTATPGADSRFAGWSGDCTGTKPKTSITIADKEKCVATFVAQHAVALAVAGSGSGGTVVSTPDLSCTALGCKGDVDDQSTVTLKATPAAGFRFVSWTGSAQCQGNTLATLTVKVTQDLSCSATFAQQYLLSVSALGASAPVGVTTGTCNALSCPADAGSSAAFRAEPVSGYRFTGWSGDALCTGTVNPLEIAKVASNITCIANYVRRFSATGLPAGVIASSGNVNASCSGNTCSLDAGTTATLLAPTIAGSYLTGWTGTGCLAANQSGNGIAVTPTTGNVTCTAQYTPGVSVTGTVVGATGVVSATSPTTGATCTPGSCAIASGGSVTLVAPTIANHRFVSWTGDAGCASATAQVTLSAVTTSKSCSANYVQQFTVGAVAGTGGTVTAVKGTGVGACTAASCTVDAGTSVALTAVPNTANGYHFTGWTGANCTPGASNPLTLTSLNAVCTAGFALDKFTIAATAGTNGTVSATPAGGAACSGASCLVDFGVNVTLVATPANNYHFVSWTGANCPSPGAASITLKSLNATCAATFAVNTFTASALVNPVNSGTVAVSCGSGGCSAVPSGQAVNFTASAGSGWAFGNWSANCGGGTNAALSLNVNTNLACTANFRPIVRAVTAPSASGTITASGSGTALCASGDPATCTADLNGSVTLTAAAGANATFKSWTGDCAGTTATITLTALSAPKNCTANFHRFWAVSTGDKGADRMTHITALADGTVVGLGETLAVGAREYQLVLAALDANTGKLSSDQIFADDDGSGTLNALGLATNSDQKSVVALGVHNDGGKTRQPFLHNEGGTGKFDLEYAYKSGGTTTALGGEVIATTDGGYAFCVAVQDPPLPSGAQQVVMGHLTKVDSSGKPVFDVQFCARDAKQTCLPTQPVDVLQDPTTKTYAVLSQVSIPRRAILLTFITDAGAVSGSAYYQDTQDLIASQFVPGSEADTYLVVGTRTTVDGSDSNAFYAEFSRAGGAPRFAYSVGQGKAEERLFSIAKFGSNYALAGLAPDLKDSKLTSDAWLVLIDKEGTIKSQLAYGGALADRANAISNVPGVGFALGGQTLNWGAGQSEMWTLRIGSDGALSFNNKAPVASRYATAFASTSLTTAITSPTTGGIGITDSSVTAVKPAVKASSSGFSQVFQAP